MLRNLLTSNYNFDPLQYSLAWRHSIKILPLYPDGRLLLNAEIQSQLKSNKRMHVSKNQYFYPKVFGMPDEVPK